MQSPNIFARITKVDEAKRLVFGRAAQEVIDKSNEIMDYVSSKPHFEKWSEEMSNDTGGKSLGNVRAMHGRVAAGKITGIDFNDTEKAIDICAKIVDEHEWNKVLEGVYSGYSIGGSYVGAKTVEKINDVEVSRYTAKPSEVSLVDRPCIPTAKFFEIQKKDGTVKQVEFKAAIEEEKVAEGIIDGTPQEVDQLVKLMNDKKLNLEAVIKMVERKKDDEDDADDKAKKPDDEEDDEEDTTEEQENIKAAKLAKGENPFAAAAKEKDKKEKDKAKGKGKDKPAEGSDEEEADEADDEAKAEGDAPKGKKKKADATDAKDKADDKKGAMAASEKMEKLDCIIAECTLMKAGARHGAADKERVNTLHKLAIELGATCEPAKAEAVTLTKIELDGAMKKAVEDAINDVSATFTKQLTEANERIQKLEKQPAPARIALRAVSKGEDLGGDDLNSSVNNQIKPVIDAHGEEHRAAGIIKFLHQQGGVPLTMPSANGK